MIIVDVETTGLSPFRHGMISVGAVNFEHPEEYFYGEGRPVAEAVLDKRALEINGFTEETVRALPKAMLDVMHEFYGWLVSQPPDTPMIMGGHNVGFDYYFLLETHKKLGLKDELWLFGHRTFDLHTVAHYHYLQKKGFMYAKTMGADYIQQKLGLPIEPSPHHALNGAVFETECFARLLFNRNAFDDFKDIPIIDNPWV
jgi:DNA polymerase III epsilon subunit-like protein